MSPDSHRTVTVHRTAQGSYTATNQRGDVISFGSGDHGFSPVELLLAAIGGCTGIDVDLLTSRRAEPTSFEVRMDAEKIKDENGNRLSDISITFALAFPEGEDGDAARAVLPEAVRLSHDRLCTVGRTVQIATPITTHIR